MTRYEIFIDREKGIFLRDPIHQQITQGGDMTEESINVERCLEWGKQADEYLKDWKDNRKGAPIPEDIRKYPLTPTQCASLTEWERANLLLKEAWKALNYIHNTNLAKASSVYKDTYDLAKDIGNFLKEVDDAR